MADSGKPRGTIEILPVTGIALVQKGDDLVALVQEALARDGTALQDGDALVLTSKVVSKSEGRIVELASVQPSSEARALARVSGREARFCEVLIRHSRKVWALIATGKKAVEWAERLPEVFPVGQDKVRELFGREPNMILAELSNGLCLTDAGIDSSNVEGAERVILLPEDPNGSCRRLSETIRERFGKSVAVIISDTEMRPNRFGSVDQAIGSWGVETVASHFGQTDLVGRPKVGGMECTTDLIVAAASLVMGNCAEGVPSAVVRGVRYKPVQHGMLPIQESPSSYHKAVVYNVWCHLRLLYYRLVGI